MFFRHDKMYLINHNAKPKYSVILICKRTTTINIPVFMTVDIINKENLFSQIVEVIFAAVYRIKIKS